MSFDTHANLARSTVATAPSPATSGTSLIVQTGDGAVFPAAPFNATLYPPNVQPTTSNSEIVRVTNISTDTFTITRAQESTSARSVAGGWIIVADVTKKTLTDIETQAAVAINRQDVSSNSVVATQHIQTGWSWEIGSGTTTMTQAITFPVAFDTAPIVLVSDAGQKNGSDPSVIGDLTDQSGWTVIEADSITTTGFTAGFSAAPKGDATTRVLTNTIRFGFTWIAIGTHAA